MSPIYYILKLQLQNHLSYQFPMDYLSQKSYKLKASQPNQIYLRKENKNAVDT